MASFPIAGDKVALAERDGGWTGLTPRRCQRTGWREHALVRTMWRMDLNVVGESRRVVIIHKNVLKADIAFRGGMAENWLGMILSGHYPTGGGGGVGRSNDVDMCAADGEGEIEPIRRHVRLTTRRRGERIENRCRWCKGK